MIFFAASSNENFETWHLCSLQIDPKKCVMNISSIFTIQRVAKCINHLKISVPFIGCFKPTVKDHSFRWSICELYGVCKLSCSLGYGGVCPTSLELFVHHIAICFVGCRRMFISPPSLTHLSSIVALFKKGVRAVQLVGRTSRYNMYACVLWACAWYMVAFRKEAHTPIFGYHYYARIRIMCSIINVPSI